MRGYAIRWAPWILLLAAAVAWIRSGPGWPNLDHGDGMALDFNVYHTQAGALFQKPLRITPAWVYPPAAVLPFLLFRPFPLPWARVLWTLLEIALALVVVRLCMRELQAWGRFRAAAVAFALVSLSLPVVHCIKWGQTSLAVGLLAFAGLRARPRNGAMLLGAAAAIKIYPLAYLIGPLVQREGRRALLALGWAAVFGVVVPAAVLGIDETKYFFGKVAYRAAAASAGDWSHGRSAAWWGGQSLPESLERWFVAGGHVGLEEDRDALLAPLPPAAVPVLGLASLAIVLAGTWRALRRTARGSVRAAMLPLIAVTLFVPPGWHHYFALLPLATATVLGDESAPGFAKATAAFAAILLAIPPLLLPDVPGVYFEFSRWGGTTVAASLAWTGLVWPRRIASARDRVSS